MWFIAIFCWLFLGVNRVEAKSYTVGPVNIEAVINRDGSMEVSEERTFNFSGDYTFAYQYINKKGERDELYILKSLTVYDEGGEYSTTTATDTSKTPSTFYVVDEGNRYYVKWYYRASNEKKRFTIKYEVANVVTLQKDIAEIYWQAVGKDWEISQRDINVKLTLPYGIEGSQIQAWAHGPLNGTVSIPNSGEVSLIVPSLQSGTFFEARILLPKSTFYNGVSGLKTKTGIIAEEEGFIAKTKSKKERIEQCKKEFSLTYKISRNGNETIVNYYDLILKKKYNRK